MFTYSIPTKIHFGEGQVSQLGKTVALYGKKALLVYGGGSIKKTGLYDTVISQLKDAGISCVEKSGIEPNPKVDSVREGIEICKKEGVDVVLAVGGGSAMDAAKFICAGACVDFDVWEFISRKAPVEKVLPLVCVLTISATGSEMDNTAVLNNPVTQEKRALIDDKLFPTASICDPTLTYTVSPYQTACGSADIFSHILESYMNINQNLYMLDTQMEGMMKTVVKYAPVAMKDGSNYEARANLMWTSSWAINGYVFGCNKNPWSCHPIEHQLSAVYDITHGLGLAIVTPRWMEWILEKHSSPETLAKFGSLGVNVFGLAPEEDALSLAKKTIECVKDFLYNKLELKSTLTDIGIDGSQFEAMAQRAVGGPDGVIAGWKPLHAADVIEIYRNSL